MSPSLQVSDARERGLVRLADVALAPLGWFRRRPAGRPVRRVLLMRLERIGDLLMVLDAIGDARIAWPEAEIDLVVGSWNEPLARLIPDITHLHHANAPWLARGSDRRDGWPALLTHARLWRRRKYDLVINFEPDIRSNLLAWLTGAPRRLGYSSGGGGSLLTDARPYTPLSHVSANASALVARAAGRSTATRTEGRWPKLIPPAEAVSRARAVLGHARPPLVGVHASGGRESKQWHLDRFAAVAREIASKRGATIVLTGAEADRRQIDAVRGGLEGVPVIDAGVLDLAALAALMAELDVLITSDTGPMHLAAAMGTPVVALFGPANPVRYGPLAPVQRVLRVDLPCSPCGQVRLPPERCRGHVPDCMDGISVTSVVAAAIEVLDRPEAQEARASANPEVRAAATPSDSDDRMSGALRAGRQP